MNILFVYSLYDVALPFKPLMLPEEIQFGISYISSVLKSHGHTTKLLVLSRYWRRENEDRIKQCFYDFQPAVVCFTAVYSEYDFIIDVARYIRRIAPDICLMVGGAHVSLNADDKMDDFDVMCIGEGEYPVLEFVSQLEKGKSPQGISNLWIKKGTHIERNPIRPFLQNLEELPFPDRQMWEEWVEMRPGSRETVMLGRGCPFTCTYCCNHALKRLAPGEYVRFRSPDSIVSEIEELAEKYAQKREIYLEVETIGLNKEWALELCSKLEGLNKRLRYPLTFGANLRIMPNLDLKSIFNAFKKSNFRFVNIGLESGSERVRQQVLKRYYSNENIIKAVKLARDYDLEVAFLNLVGLPGETLSDFKETVRINRQCLPDWSGMSIFFPYPGTELYSLCKKQKLLKKNILGKMERGRAVLDLPGFSKKQIENSYAWFEYLIYKGHRPLHKLLLKTIFLKIRTRPFLFLLYRRIKSLMLIFVLRRRKLSIF